jgi:transposase
LGSPFNRLEALRGRKRALIVVANSILTAGYYMLHRATTYQDLGPDYFDKRNTVRATHCLVKRLEALGQRVILEPRFIADPST